MTRDILDSLLARGEQQRAAVLVTDLNSGHQCIVDGSDSETADAVLAAARKTLITDTCSTFDVDGRTLFLQPFNPPQRMIVVGAVHIAQPLAVMATAVGWDVIIVDPRHAWATEERFPGVRLLHEWPGDALAALAPDRRTAVLTLTHDPKLDDPALLAALRSPAFYVGALGSRKTHDARLERLAGTGLPPDALRRIHSPIGIDIDARTPAEIAIAILAEITSVLRGGH